MVKTYDDSYSNSDVTESVVPSKLIVEEQRKKRKFKTLPNVSEMCDRYNVSDRAGAAIATAALQDFGIVDSASKLMVTDQSKVRRH